MCKERRPTRRLYLSVPCIKKTKFKEIQTDFTRLSKIFCVAHSYTHAFFAGLCKNVSKTNARKPCPKNM